MVLHLVRTVLVGAQAASILATALYAVMETTGEHLVNLTALVVRVLVTCRVVVLEAVVMGIIRSQLMEVSFV